MYDKKYHAWTSKDDKILRVLHMRHTSICDIATFLQRTESAVKHRKKALGLSRILYDDLWHENRREKRRKAKSFF